MNALTERQREVLDFIVDFQVENGFPPTMREIAEGIGITSTNGVHDHLSAIERKGYIQRKRGTSRAIKILNAGEWRRTAPHPVALAALAALE